MLNNSVKAMIAFLDGNFNEIFVYVVSMMSAIIVAIGLLKPVLFDKIKNKHIRKVALSFSNVGACFICALVLFFVKDWDFKYYLVSAIALTISCIVTYWLYENTCLRNLIGTIGSIALKKIAGIAFIAVNTDDINEIKTEAKKASDELKAQTYKAIKKAKDEISEDKDLKGL